MMRATAPMDSQRGLSLVELLVGAALGLGVIASTSTLLMNHLSAHARITVDMRVSQELHAAMAVLARDLRRAGYWRDAWIGVSTSRRDNPYQAITPEPNHGASSAVAYAYSRDEDLDNNRINTSGNNERFGFHLQDGVVLTRVGGAPQALTDAASVWVSGLTITAAQTELSLGSGCWRQPSAPDASTATVASAACCRPHEVEASLCKPAIVHRTGLGTEPASGVVPAVGMVISAQCPEMINRSFDVVLRGRALLPSNGAEQAVHQTVQVRNDTMQEGSCP